MTAFFIAAFLETIFSGGAALLSSQAPIFYGEQKVRPTPAYFPCG